MLPLLTPLLAALAVAVANPGPVIALRLLTWRSPSLPLGAWIAAAALGGAAISGTATALALRDAAPRLRRRVHRRRAKSPWELREEEPWSPEPPPVPPPTAGPERAPGEPAPTVSVPYRVIHRPARAQATAVETPRPPQAPEADDWQQEIGEEW